MNPVRRNSDPVRDPKDKSSNEARTSPQSTGWPSPDGQAHNGVNEQNLEVSIVAPCFNEADNVGPLYEQITQTLTDKYDYEIIFVDGRVNSFAKG
ncbi:hypothetical protein ES703_44590 [subsurface metagenome]